MRKINLADFRVATSETARDINRRIVLSLIRNHQPITRADLARYSGLQRSTISAITEQLIAERWVREGALGHLPRGRKPRLLHLNVERVGVVGINIRPTRTEIAVAHLDGSFLAQQSIPTAKDSKEFVAELSRRIRNLIEAQPHVAYEGIGISLPGRVDSSSGKLVFAPNLAWSDGMDLKTPLEHATGLPVELENAANACALAAFWFGKQTENLRDVVAVTVSEGIGVGMIHNGQLLRGTTGVAGEFGHVAIGEAGLPCSCGNRDCWEAYASNSAAVRYYTQAISSSGKRRHRASSTAMPTFEDILRLAEQGDLKARETLDRMAHYLGVGIAMLVSGLAPELIVVVGEVTRAWERVDPILHRVVKARSLTHAPTRIVPTDPDAQPRLRGTVALVLQKHFGAPLVA